MLDFISEIIKKLISIFILIDLFLLAICFGAWIADLFLRLA